MKKNENGGLTIFKSVVDLKEWNPENEILTLIACILGFLAFQYIAVAVVVSL